MRVKMLSSRETDLDPVDHLLDSAFLQQESALAKLRYLTAERAGLHRFTDLHLGDAPAPLGNLQETVFVHKGRIDAIESRRYGPTGAKSEQRLQPLVGCRAEVAPVCFLYSLSRAAQKGPY